MGCQVGVADGLNDGMVDGSGEIVGGLEMVGSIETEGTAVGGWL